MSLVVQFFLEHSVYSVKCSYALDVGLITYICSKKSRELHLLLIVYWSQSMFGCFCVQNRTKLCY